MQMYGPSSFSWIAMLVMAVVFLVPIAKILMKAGFSGWWTILAVIPLANIIGLWVLAFVAWPGQKT